MTVAKPQNREEFKQNIKIRLGAPVLEINVSDEQMDICIERSSSNTSTREVTTTVTREYIFQSTLTVPMFVRTLLHTSIEQNRTERDQR